REIVKDIEDVYGDKASGLKTLVIAKGVRFSSAIVRLLSVVLLVILAYWGSVILDFQTLNIFNIYFVCGLFLPVAFISYLSIRLVKLKNIRFLQQYLKAVMISGLIFIALFAWI
ncbi:MAG: hypothetical protein HKN09_04595, partial [Saprospiraceae bacterium]|nr:hypothetical protein [Saprospiraceae bacterium]